MEDTHIISALFISLKMAYYNAGADQQFYTANEKIAIPQQT